MKHFLWFILLATSTCTAWGDTRTWTTANGKHSVEAEFLLANTNDVFLRLSDGGRYWIPVANFCAADQAYIQSLVRTSGGIPPTVWAGILRFAKNKYEWAELQQEEIRDQQKAYWDIQLKLASDEYAPGAIKKALELWSIGNHDDYVWQLEHLDRVETKPEAEKRRAKYGLGLTRQGYEAIEVGMGKIEVDLILVCRGVESSSAGSLATYAWQHGFTIVTATFDGDKLVAKAQVGF